MYDYDPSWKNSEVASNLLEIIESERAENIVVAEEVADDKKETLKSQQPVKQIFPIKVTKFPSYYSIFTPNDESSKSQAMREALQQFESKLFEKSINVLKNVVLDFGIEGDTRYALLNMATIYLKMELFNNSAKKAEEFLNSGPPTKADNYAKFVLAKSLLGMKKWDNAEKLFKKIKPDSKYGSVQKEINLSLATLYQATGHNKKAVSYLKKELRKSKDMHFKSRINYQIAQLYLKLGQNTNAVSHMKKTILQCTDSIKSIQCPEAYIKIADIFFKQKKWKTAIQKYKEFYKNYPKHKEVPWCIYQIANIYKIQGDYKHSLNNYKLVIDQFPNSYWSIQAKWKQDDAVWQNEYKEVFN